MPSAIHIQQSGETIGAMSPVATALPSAGIKASWSDRIKDQSLFSARTTEQSYVEYLQRILRSVAEGTVRPDQAEEKLREALKNLGYAPQSGLKGQGSVAPVTPGSIRDLSSSRRIQLILDTNIKQARSLGQLADSEDPAMLLGFPAWRLTRTGARKKPRGDWAKRWTDAGNAAGWVGASKKDMVALKTSPIWEMLGKGVGNHKDAIGSPYPPFAFGSGLSWVNVGRSEWLKICEREGLPDGMDAVRERARELKYAKEGGAEKPFTEIVKSPSPVLPPTPLAPPKKAGARQEEKGFVPSYRQRLSADKAVDDALEIARSSQGAIDGALEEMEKTLEQAKELVKDYEDSKAEILPVIRRIEVNLERIRGRSADTKSLVGKIVNYGSSVSTYAKPRSSAEQKTYDGEMTRLSVLSREAADESQSYASLASLLLSATRKSIDGIVKKVCGEEIARMNREINGIKDKVSAYVKDKTIPWIERFNVGTWWKNAKEAAGNGERTRFSRAFKFVKDKVAR